MVGRELMRAISEKPANSVLFITVWRAITGRLWLMRHLSRVLTPGERALGLYQLHVVLWVWCCVWWVVLVCVKQLVFDFRYSCGTLSLSAVAARREPHCFRVS